MTVPLKYPRPVPSTHHSPWEIGQPDPAKDTVAAQTQLPGRLVVSVRSIPAGLWLQGALPPMSLGLGSLASSQPALQGTA